ncbi:hypothetical protein REPUB_Repub01dG0105000 [Reevesia pubescens]
MGGVGFKNLHLFNISILAKQGWRLLKHLDSLYFRVLKNKYFPNCSTMEAQIRGNASFTWCSICAAREVL